MEELKTVADNGKSLTKFLKKSDLLFTFSLFGIVLLMVLPISTHLIDVLLALSIGISLFVLLIVVYLKDPAEFSIFPTMLLTVTLYRLGLNIASTRLILLDGYAGEVINSFGNFVVRGNYVVGSVIFLILVVINFVVITKGAGRIAEVAARFTLDAMPGKQMAIDAELNAGVIDEASATKKRQKVQKEADFYGAMDGASKFVRGDAIASVLITLINIVGGITIGVLQKNLPIVESLKRYSLLSIGDGLISQIPSLIVSVGAGILITRTSEGENLGANFGRQLVAYPRAVKLSGYMMAIFAIIPGMPFFPFAFLGGILFVFSSFLTKSGISSFMKTESEKNLPKIETVDSDGEPNVLPNETPKPGTLNDLKKMIESEIFAIELGYSLLPLADKRSSGDLLERIISVRQKFARDMGLIIPTISVRDSLEIEANQYRFLMRGKVLAVDKLMPNNWLAMNISNSSVQLKGIATKEPVFGLNSFWIEENEKGNAEMNGYTVVDAPSVFITHLSETLKDYSSDLLEREDTQKLIDIVKEKNPTLVNELLPDLVNIGLIQRVLKNLLKEKISIKNINLILETIGDFAQYTKNSDELSEQVRKRLGQYFIHEYEVEKNLIQAITLDPNLEQLLVAQIKKTQFDIVLLMDPLLTQDLLKEIGPRLNQLIEQGLDPIVLITSEARLAFKRFFEPTFPRMIVLAYQELPNDVQVKSIGVIPFPKK